jgi:hypothetical protein
MSALPFEADVDEPNCHVRLGPGRDIACPSEKARKCAWIGARLVGHCATQIVFDPGLSTQSNFGPDSPDFRFFLSTEYGV